ncbi:formate/nitrite transporter family protein [Acidithiobacillus sp. M4-SHS-6]|uniref:formate/nitrite transporter family protein n=1 Tax=Acidithiobacillus sp. M4-SHS-6 TaxID=3383024 RepID=UPI0039BDC075
MDTNNTIDVDNERGRYTSELLEPKSIVATLEIMCTMAVCKWRNPIGFFWQSISGGAMVMFGVMLAVSVGAGIPYPGWANLASGFVFGFSFVIIMVSNSSLITSDMAAGFIALWRKKMSLQGYIGYLLLGWVGNVIGAFIFIGIIAVGPGDYAMPVFLMRAHMIGLSKVIPSGLSVFCMGIICTWLLQLGYFLYIKSRTDVGKMVMAWYGPLAFVGGMTEHCIANIGFIGLPLLMQNRYIAALHNNSTIKPEHIVNITWGFGHYGLARNELISWCGNWVGGTLFIAILFMAIAKYYKKDTI